MYRVQKLGVRGYEAGKAGHGGERRWRWWREDLGRTLQEIPHERVARSLPSHTRLAAVLPPLGMYSSAFAVALCSYSFCL